MTCGFFCSTSPALQNSAAFPTVYCLNKFVSCDKFSYSPMQLQFLAGTWQGFVHCICHQICEVLPLSNSRVSTPPTFCTSMKHIFRATYLFKTVAANIKPPQKTLKRSIALELSPAGSYWRIWASCQTNKHTTLLFLSDQKEKEAAFIPTLKTEGTRSMAWVFWEGLIVMTWT